MTEGAAKKDKESKEELKEGRMMVMVVINDYMHLNEKHGKEEVGD